MSSVKQRKIEQPFRFLDLIPEIRNMVYERLLPPRRVLRPWSGRVIRKHKMKLVWGGEVAPLMSLLRANRQLNAEVTPVVYGANTFELKACASTIHWLKDIGSMKKFIRHVEMDIDCSTTVTGTLHQLKQAEGLQTFSIPSVPWDRYARADGHSSGGMAHTFGPFVKNLYKARKDVNTKEDIIQIIRAASFTEWQKINRAGRNKELKAYVEGLREALKEILS